MAQTDTAFWNTLQATDLLTDTQRKWVRKQWLESDSPPSDSPSLAQDLVQKGWLTPFQVGLISQNLDSAANLRPFHYGPFVLIQDLQPPGYLAAHQFLAALTDQHADRTFRDARFVLRFLSGTSDAIWQLWKESLKRPVVNSGHLLPVVAAYQKGRYRALVEWAPEPSVQSLPQWIGQQVDFAQKGVGLKPALKLAAGLASALESLHQQGQVAGVLMPEQVFVDCQGQALLRSVSDIALQHPESARQWYKIDEAARRENGEGPMVVTDRDKPSTAHSDTYQLAWLRPVAASDPVTWAVADFLAPELLHGQPATTASDLYSLGCLIHWLTLGKLPYPPASGSSEADWQAFLEARKQSLAFSDDCPKPISKLLERLLAIDPNQRKLSTRQVAQSLWALLKKEPLTVPTGWNSPSIEQARQWLEIQDERIFGDEESTEDIARDQPVLNLNAGIRPEREALGTLVVGNPDEGTPRRWQERQKHQSNWLLYSGISASALLMLTLVIWGGQFFGGSDPVAAGPDPAETIPVGPENNTPPSTSPASELLTANEAGYWSQRVVKDDGQLLWESPTVAAPVTMPRLPNNPFAVCWIRGSFFEQPQFDGLVRAIQGIRSSEAAWLGYIDQWKMSQFDVTILAQYQQANQADHVIQMHSEKGVPLTLEGWKVVGRLPQAFSLPEPAEDSDAATSQTMDVSQSNDSIANDSLDSEPLAGDESAKTPVADTSQDSALTAETTSAKQSLLLVRQQAGNLQVAVVTAAMPDSPELQSLSLVPVDRLAPEMFDPEYAEDQLPVMDRVHSLLVAAPQWTIRTLQNQGATELTLPMTYALDCTDQDRQFQMIVDPISVWNEAGRNWLGAERQWVAELIKTQLPPDVRALYAAAHFDGQQVYLESKMIQDRTAKGDTLLQTLRSRLQQTPLAVERKILDVPRLAFWDSGLIQFDNMLESLAEQLRYGQHDQVPTINCWLPASASTNLLAELDLYFTATQFASASMVAESTGPAAPDSLAELLQAPLTLKIPEQDLINAVADLQNLVTTKFKSLPFPFAIELDGTNLGIDGITQNQKISNFEMVDQSLASILTALVLKGNPDPSATSANDPKCKLIWLPHPQESGKILITTRKAANDNQWTLPPETAEKAAD